MATTFTGLKQEVQQELLNILNYWKKYSIDNEKGGFYGVVNDKNIPDKNAPRSIVINSRILWTFSAAQQLFPHADYPVIAKRAFDYIEKYFIDEKYGGVYWSVAADGSPLQTKKQLYGHAFAIYGLSEYYKISKENAVLKLAIDIFSKFVNHSYDKVKGGYVEAFEQDWSNTTDYILSRAPLNKSMNTHLHLLEAFTNLYSVSKDETSKFHLRHSIEVMLDHIIDPRTNTMTLFFTNDWQRRSPIISYGHDIEASWLLCEAAEMLGDEHLTERAKAMSIKLANAAADGIAEDGSLYYELNTENKHLNKNKHWWPQAETLVGFLNAWQLTNKVHYLEKMEKNWEYIKKYMIDRDKGEWCGNLDENNQVVNCDKITFWKCPYHNGRACMELWKRLG